MILMLAAVPALFVGNRACAPCHGSIVRAYSGTGMAHSSGRVTNGVTPGSFHHAATGVSYEIHTTGLVLISKGSTRAERKLDYFIGSGAAGQSFASARDGFLFEAPLTWYAQSRRWDASPGYEDDRVSRWNRPVEPSCLYCHASQTRWREGSQNGYRDPPFAQDGVGCERCHGPGSLHVEGKGKMVNPARLEPARREAVCAQCHLSGRARIERVGGRMEDYQPGDRLSDYVAYFVAESSGALRVTSHVETLTASRCKRSAGDRLWCGTCHDPHRTPAAAERAAWYRAKCLSCHQVLECGRGFDCASCHMPKGRAVDGGHGVFTDHSIPRRARAAPAQAADSWRLLGFSSADTGDRELGLAYAEIYLTTDDERQRSEAIRLLASVPPDPEVEVRLADLYERAGNPQGALPLYQSALGKNPDALAALVNLGRLYGSGGQMKAAIRLWRTALQHNPCLAEAGINLQIALQATGNVAAAQTVKESQTWCQFK
jgi:predicted CXXCH cytochrome family protein